MKFEHSQVTGFEAALRGMRNPLDSHHRADSGWVEKTDGVPTFEIGPNDMDLCRRLIKGGPEHRKFLRMIHIQVDITAERFFWSQLDTYRVGVSANSQSTMHTIHRRNLTGDDFGLIEVPKNPMAEKMFDEYLENLNKIIETYRENRTSENLLLVKELLPESFLQTRTVDLTYESLMNIVNQRRHHKLPQWKEFIKWACTTPYAEEFGIV